MFLCHLAKANGSGLSQSHFDDNFQQSSLQPENYYPFVEPNFWFDLLAMLLIISFFLRLVWFGLFYVWIRFDGVHWWIFTFPIEMMEKSIWLLTFFSRQIYILRFNWIPLNDPKSHTNKYNDDDDDSFRFSIEMTMNWTELNRTERINCSFFSHLSHQFVVSTRNGNNEQIFKWN